MNEGSEMFETLKQAFRPRTVRIVDHGNAFCPVRQRDVDIDECMTCAHLAEFRAGEDGGVTAIVCTPTYRALAASDLL